MIVTFHLYPVPPLWIIRICTLLFVSSYGCLRTPTLFTIFPPSFSNALNLCFSLHIGCLCFRMSLLWVYPLLPWCWEMELASWWAANMCAISTCHSHNLSLGSCSFQCFQTQIFQIILCPGELNVSVTHDPSSIQCERCSGCIAMQWRTVGCSQAGCSGAQTQCSCQLCRLNSWEQQVIHMKRKNNSVVRCLAFPSCLS